MKLELYGERNGDRGTFTYSTTKEAMDGGAPMSRRPSKRDIKQSAWHESGHAVFNLAVIDPQTQFHNGHASFKGIWVRFSAEEASRVDMAQLDLSGGPLLSDKPQASGAVLKNGDIWCNDFDEITLYMAGIAGHRIFNGRKKVGKIKFVDWFQGGAHDLSMAAKIAKSNGRGWDVDTVLNRAVERAWNILKLHPVAHRKIAELLEQHGYVSYDRAKEIFEAEVLGSDNI